MVAVRYDEAHSLIRSVTLKHIPSPIGLQAGTCAADRPYDEPHAEEGLGVGLIIRLDYGCRLVDFLEPELEH